MIFSYLLYAVRGALLRTHGRLYGMGHGRGTAFIPYSAYDSRTIDAHTRPGVPFGSAGTAGRRSGMAGEYASPDPRPRQPEKHARRVSVS